MDRPLTSLEDLKSHIGYEIRLTADPIEGRKHFRGNLLEVLEDAMKVNVDKKYVLIPYSSVHHARLVINDSLINAVMKGQNLADDEGETKPKAQPKPQTKTKPKPKKKHS